MNILTSLEDVISPVHEDKAPIIGLVAEDFDANALAAVAAINSHGFHVQVQEKPAMESNAEHDPQVLYYYKDQDGQVVDPGQPVLVVNEGTVQVSHEGRVKELAEYLGMLNDDHVELTEV